MTLTVQDLMVEIESMDNRIVTESERKTLDAALDILAGLTDEAILSDMKSAFRNGHWILESDYTVRDGLGYAVLGVGPIHWEWYVYPPKGVDWYGQHGNSTSLRVPFQTRAFTERVRLLRTERVRLLPETLS